MKRGAFLSDTHCGSIFGMLPPDFGTSDGAPKSQNVGQQYLWECWAHAALQIANFKPDFVVFNGDGIDGRQEAQRGSEFSLPLIFDQKRAFVSCMQYMLAGLETKLYVTQGTEYHDGKGAEAMEDAAQILGAQQYQGLGSGIFTKEALDLSVEGIIINCAHHISVASGFYRLTAIDREMQWAAMTGKDASKGIPKADLIVRSHCHHYTRGEHPSKDGFTTPCWQLQTRFMRKGSHYRMLPDIGYVLVEVDGAAKEKGEEPCQIRKHIYRLPPAPVTML